MDNHPTCPTLLFFLPWSRVYQFLTIFSWAEHLRRWTKTFRSAYGNQAKSSRWSPPLLSVYANNNKRVKGRRGCCKTIHLRRKKWIKMYGNFFFFYWNRYYFVHTDKRRKQLWHYQNSNLPMATWFYWIFISHGCESCNQFRCRYIPSKRIDENKHWKFVKKKPLTKVHPRGLVFVENIFRIKLQYFWTTKKTKRTLY